MSKVEVLPPRYNVEQLEKILEGVKVWNDWYIIQANNTSRFVPNLENATFLNGDLKGANLHNANLKDATFYGTELKGADFSYAQLQKADFRGAIASGGDFSYTNLKGAVFNHVELLEKTNFKGANLQEAHLYNAILEFANFSDTNLQDADLRYANLKNVNLQDADFSNANLAYTTNICFSDNKIEGTIITSTTTAPWLTLKKNYTNTMMLFHIVGVIAFFLPYLVNVTIWRSLNLLQELNLIETLNENIFMTKCLAENCTSWQIWELLIGLRRNWVFAGLSLVLIPYNGFRIFLTQQVSVLKDSEQATGITPTWKRDLPDVEQRNVLFGLCLKLANYRHGYRFLFRIHQVLRVIFWIAIISAGIHAFQWLTDIVELPTK